VKNGKKEKKIVTAGGRCTFKPTAYIIQCTLPVKCDFGEMN